MRYVYWGPLECTREVARMALLKLLTNGKINSDDKPRIERRGCAFVITLSL